MPLSEYKFDRSRLVVVKRTSKCSKSLIEGVEKFVVEGFEESTLWDISGPDIARVGVEALAMIAGMALARQSSIEEMIKEIDCLKQFASWLQAELVEHTKNMLEDKKQSLDEMKVALESRYEKEKQQLKEKHVHELEEL